MTQAFEIRPAQVTDFKTIAELHVRSWHKAYSGEFPEETLAGEIADALRGSWTSYVPKDSDLVLVVEQDAELVGFAAVWCHPDPYLDNLHIIEQASGAGAGKALVSTLAQTLIARGHSKLSLTVFESNEAARAFYAKLGGTESAPFKVGLFGVQVNCITVTWSDLSALT